MSAHSLAPGRVRHATNPRPPWTSAHRHARRRELLWRASTAVETTVGALCCLVLVVAVVLIPVALLTGGAQ